MCLEDKDYLDEDYLDEEVVELERRGNDEEKTNRGIKYDNPEKREEEISGEEGEGSGRVRIRVSSEMGKSFRENFAFFSRNRLMRNFSYFRKIYFPKKAKFRKKVCEIRKKLFANLALVFVRWNP